MSQSASPPEPEVELVAQVITGYRAFHVRRNGKLATLNQRTLNEGPEHPAVCDPTMRAYLLRDEHESPAWGCTCGYYAVPAPTHDWHASWHAVVELWGTVIEHDDGWRAQYQRLVEIAPPARCSWCPANAGCLAVKDGFLVGWCGVCGDHERVEAPASLLAGPRITWGTIDPAGPPPPTLAAEVAKLTKAITGLGTLGSGVRPIPREVEKWVLPGSTTYVNRIQTQNTMYAPVLRIEHCNEGWRMLLLSPTGMIVWDTIIPYAAGPDPRFG